MEQPNTTAAQEPPTPHCPLSETIRRFQRDTTVPNLPSSSQKAYSIFCHRRQPSLYKTFFALLPDAPPDNIGATFVQEFSALVPKPAPVCGMAKSSTPHGLIRYELLGSCIEECRYAGKEHGLHLTCTQEGDFIIRLFSHGKRLAQFNLNANCSRETGSYDGGGLELLKTQLHLVIECLTRTGSYHKDRV
ncbi:hypothetical protein TeGR_g6239 [Tetraparma gracilis]|uniref:Uncharacterized protein n=1 Tax=Tetraparma gracilis TaxID=2962635 RepID=A0ABQ6M761_9STRA|nr:hypothetical protein TeGR_g6239 [Tetraparma gracilis]